MTVVSELDLAEADLAGGELTGEKYHEQLAALAASSPVPWLIGSPLALVVLDRESGEFFLRCRATAFPGREIADLFGVTAGPLREQIDANILNQQGTRHRRLRALVGPAFTPRAADRWRPVMRGFLNGLWAQQAPGPADAASADVPPAGAGGRCDFVAAVAGPARP